MGRARQPRPLAATWLAVGAVVIVHLCAAASGPRLETAPALAPAQSTHTQPAHTRPAHIQLASSGHVPDAHHSLAPPEDFDEPIGLYGSGVLGTYTRPVTTAHADARAYFVQGVRLMYAFAKVEAGRSFREAQRRDPACAMCAWGEAWAWGSYVNGRMTAREAPRAHAAIMRAARLAEARASPVERALIEAMRLRYPARFDPAARAAQDAAYARAMVQVAAAYPADAEAATLAAEALFLLLPRPGSFDLADPVVARLRALLEGVLARDAHHPGACHLYIHTMELTTQPARAAACAEWLGDAMPGASHLNHMPAHVWIRLGRWDDAVRASVRAWESDRRASRGEGIATYPAHDLQMLAFAASMDGQASLALQAGRGVSTLTGDPTLQLLTIIRFGRFDLVPAAGARPSGELAGGAWDFADGYARLRGGDRAAARQRLARLLATASASRAVSGIHPVKTLLSTLGGILEGELARDAGERDAAIAAFTRAVASQDRLLIDDPPPLPLSARHWLGAMLLEAKRSEEAERVYRDDLTRHPRNAWALVGLRQVLAARGAAGSAAASTATNAGISEIDTALRASQTRWDVSIPASRF